MIATPPQKSILNLSVDFVKPLLGTLGLLPVCFDLGLEFGNPIFGRAELVRKLLRHINCVSAVLLSDIGSLVQKLEDRLPSLVELRIVVVSPTLGRSRKLNYFRAHC